MKMISQISVLFMISLLFVACGKQPTTNNIISDTSMLKPSHLKDGAHYYLKKGLNFKAYNKIVIPNIPIINDAKDTSIDENILDSASGYFRVSLLSSLNSVINKNMGQGILKVEVAVTSLGKEYKDLKFYQYIPIGLAITAIKRGVGGEDKNLVIGIALKVTDTRTNEVVAMVVDSDVKKGFDSDHKITLEDLKPSLDEWVKHYTKRLQEFIDGKHTDM